jgi:UDP-glucose 4-epimerase
LNFLITGGAGFIGSHLADELVARGDKVVVLDNFSTGVPENLNQIARSIELHEGNILDDKLMDKLIVQSDFVVHLAAAVGVLNIVKKPLESLRTNLKGTEIILELANKYGKPVLLASTSEIYGKNNKVPLGENDDRIIGHPLISRWSYSEAKAVDESLAFFYFEEHQLPIRIVRLFNTVGPRQIGNYGMVVPRFVSAALRSEPLYVHGSGNQIRCFCHVADVVRALILAIDSEVSIGQVFNVGNDHQTSIMQLAKRITAVTDSKSVIKNLPYEQAYPEGYEDMQRRVPDISKIKKVLDWQPEIDLNQIIKDVAAFNPKHYL